MPFVGHQMRKRKTAIWPGSNQILSQKISYANWISQINMNISSASVHTKAKNNMYCTHWLKWTFVYPSEVWKKFVLFTDISADEHRNQPKHQQKSNQSYLRRTVVFRKCRKLFEVRLMLSLLESVPVVHWSKSILGKYFLIDYNTFALR